MQSGTAGIKVLFAALAVAALGLCGFFLFSGDGDHDAAGIGTWTPDQEIAYDAPDANPAEADGESAGRRQEAQAAEPVDQGIEQPAPRPQIAIRGRIVTATGLPVADAVVHLHIRQQFGGGARGGRNNARRRGGPGAAGAEVFAPEDFMPRRVGGDVRTTKEGKFEFRGTGFRQMAFAVIAHQDGFAPAIESRTWSPIPEGIDVGDVVLKNGASVVGAVVDPGGVPIPKASVTFRPEDGGSFFDRSRLLEALFKPVETNQAGVFTVKDLPEGAFRMRATAKSMLPGATEVHRLKQGELTDVGPIRLGQGYKVTGLVADAGNRPVAGAEVTVFGPGRFGEDPKATSDQNGRFEVDGVPRAPLSIRAQKKGFQEGRLDQVDAAKGADLMLTVKPALAIAGIVVDAVTGAPVESFGARARRIWEDDSATRAPGNQDRGGRDRGGRNPRPEGAAVEGIEQVRAAESMMQELRERARQGLGGGGRRGMPGFGGRPEKHPGGTFLLGDLTPGLYVVDVNSPDHMRTSSTEVRLLDGQTEPVKVRVELQRGLTISGVCLDKTTGVPVEGVQMSLLRQDPDALAALAPRLEGMGRQMLDRFTQGRGRQMGFPVDRTRSDKEGKFRFAHQQPGSYSISADHDLHAPARTDPFEVIAGRDVDSIRVDLTTGGLIHGKVLGMKPGDEKKARVVAVEIGGQREETDVEADGTYRIEHLSPGGYYVRAHLDGNDQSWMAREMFQAMRGDAAPKPEVVLTDGSAVRFDVELREAQLSLIEGSVTTNGKPAHGAEVVLSPADPQVAGAEPGGGPGRMRMPGFMGAYRATVDQSGTFRIESVPTGRYALEVRRGGGRGPGQGGPVQGAPGPGGRGRAGNSRLHRQEIFVGKGQSLTFPITLLMGGLEGSVAPAESEGEATLQGVRAFLVLAEDAKDKPPQDLRPQDAAASGRVEGSKFVFDEVTSGDYVLVVQAQGRKRWTRSVYVPAGNGSPVEVKLERSEPQPNQSPTQPGGARQGGNQPAGGRQGGR